MKSLASTTKYRVDVMATVWTHIFFGNNSECCGSSTESLKEEAGQDIIADLNDNDVDGNTVEEKDDNVVVNHVELWLHQILKKMLSLEESLDHY